MSKAKDLIPGTTDSYGHKMVLELKLIHCDKEDCDHSVTYQFKNEEDYQVFQELLNAIVEGRGFF